MRAIDAALPAQTPAPWQNMISDGAVLASRAKAIKSGMIVNPFAGGIPKPPPGVIPKGRKVKMAMDNQVVLASAWASQELYNAAFFNGVTFMGYTYLSELAQRPEYRKATEVTATEMTREWIEFKSTSTGKDTKSERIKELVKEMERLRVQHCFKKSVELDSFMGRSHLYIDTGDGDNADELKTSIGNGNDEATRLKYKGRTGFFKRLQPVEPVWCYPADYNSNDPLAADWYNPQSWFALGKQLHVTRLLCFVGREVPDLLKPAYSFGGLSLSQMMKPYVDNWLRTRQAVSDLIYSFSVSGLKTEMDASTTQGGLEMLKRAELLSNIKNNQGVLLLDKATEEWFNIATPLSSLDKLQAQAQEQMASVTSIPLVKLLGITPSGLNATSEGEIQVWYEWIKAYQESFLRPHLQTVVWLTMMSLWGEVDEEIVFEFRPIKALSAKELAELQKIEMEMDVGYVSGGVLDPMEIRERLASDPDSPYAGLDIDADDVDLATGEESDLEADAVPGGAGVFERPPSERRGAEPRERAGAEERRTARMRTRDRGDR